MTNERAVEILNLDLDILGQYGDETAEAYKMAIKALEQQLCKDCISRQKALDCFEQTNTRQGAKYAIETLPSVTPQIEPSEDCISRAEVRRILGNEVFELTKLHTVNPEDNPKADAMAYGVNWSLNTLMELPSVTPRINLALTSQDCISREEAINEADNLSLETSYDNEKVEQMLRDLPSVTPKYTDEEIDKAQAVEQAYVDKMVELAVEESRKKWLNSFDTSSATKCFEAVNLLKQRLEGEE